VTSATYIDRETAKRQNRPIGAWACITRHANELRTWKNNKFWEELMAFKFHNTFQDNL
jgi:hypothetical protein